MLEPLVVVALWEVEAELRAARLLALERAGHDALRAVEHVPELDRPEHVLVEDRAAVVDVGALGLALEAADDLERLREARLVAEDRALLVHHRAELVLDLRDAPAGAVIAAQDALDHLLLEGERLRRGGRHAHAAGPLRGVGARAAAEDQRVQERVGPEPVAAVDGDAGDLAGGVEA